MTQKRRRKKIRMYVRKMSNFTNSTCDSTSVHARTKVQILQPAGACHTHICPQAPNLGIPKHSSTEHVRESRVTPHQFRTVGTDPTVNLTDTISMNQPEYSVHVHGKRKKRHCWAMRTYIREEMIKLVIYIW